MRLERGYGVCVDTRLEQSSGVLYKIDLQDFFLLTLFNSNFSDSQISEIINRANYGDALSDSEVFEYIVQKYSDILETSEFSGKRKSIILENSYLDFPIESGLENKLSYPLMASIRITNYCDNRCIYCFNHSNQTSANYLDYKDISIVADQLKLGGVSTINITGGDPLCHPDIYAVLKLLVSYGFFLGLSTKRLLDDANVKQLCECGIKRIQISIDSNDDSINERLIHRQQYYHRQKNSIQYLVARGIEVNVNSVVTAINVDTIVPMLHDLDSVGVKNLFLTPYLSVSETIDKILMPSPKQIEQLIDNLSQVHLQNILWEFAVPEQDETFSFFNGEHRMCTGGRMSIVINHTGDVTVCERLVDDPRFIVGNIKNSPIIEIWNSEAMKKLTHPTQEYFVNTECENCDVFHKCITCDGVCYARIVRATDRKYACDPFCVKSNRKMRFH